MLTTGTTDNLVGTANNDTVTAVNSSVASEGTLQVTDKIDGAAGTDTANISMGMSFTGFTTGSMKNVETANITNTSTAQLDFDASGVTEVTKYTINATTASVTLSDVVTLADVEVTGPANNGVITVGYATTSIVSTGAQTDTQKLKVTNVGTANTKTDGTDDAKVGTVTIAKVEALEITTAGTANTLNLGGVSDATSIKITGAGTTQINAIDDSVKTFDASGATGKVIANLSGAAAATLTTVKSGSGDDTLTVSAADMKINAAVAGGTGADKLVLDASAGATLGMTMSGVETLEVKSTSGVTFSGSNVTDLTTVNLSAIGGAVSLLNMGTTALEVNGVGTIAQTVSSDTAAAVTYNLKASAAQLTAGTAAAANTTGATFDSATALTINVNELVDSDTGAISAAQATSLTLNVASKVVNAAELTEFSNAITAGEATSVTVASTGQLIGATINAAKATSMTLTTGSSTAAATEVDTLTLNATKLSSLNVTAKQDLTITEGTSTAGLDSIQTLTVTTDNDFVLGGFGGNATTLDDIATATIGGTATTASADLGNLGNANMTHNINLTATGLKAGLTVGTVNAGTGSATLNVSGVTGAIATGNAINGDGGVTLTATNIAEALTGTAAITSKGNISVDVTNAAKAVTLGTLKALTGTAVTGDVTVLANNIAGVLTLGAIEGNNVTVNTKTAGSAVVEAGVTAKTSVTWTAADLFADNVAIATTTDSTAFTATLAGGAMGEIFAITGSTAQTGITATGNLGAGTNRVDVTLGNSTATGQTVTLSGLTSSATAGDATGATLAAGSYETNVVLNAETNGNITVVGSAKDDLVTLAGTHTGTISITDSTTTDKDMLSLTAALATTTLTLSGIEGITVAAAAGTSINASAISGQTITITQGTNDLTLAGSAGDDTINLVNITTTAAAVGDFIINGDTGNDIITGTATAETINGGAGNDTIVAGAGNDLIVVGATTEGNGDTIEGGADTDTLDLTGASHTFATDNKLVTVENITFGSISTLNLTGQTESFNITANVGGLTVTTGSALDIVTAAGGTDVITLGTTQAAADIIKSFATGTDDLKYSGALLNVATATLVDAGVLGAAATIDAAIGISAIATQYVFDNAAFDIDASLVAHIAAPTATTSAAIVTAAMTALNATAKTSLDATFLSTETVLFVLDGTAGTSSAVFAFTNTTATGNAIDAGELVLVGVTDAVIATGVIIL